MVVWLSEPVAGLSRARNRAIDAARGQVIVTTDDDVLPPPGWLALLAEPLFDESNGLAATTGDCVPVKVETEAEKLFEIYGCLSHGSVPVTFDRKWMDQWRVGFPHLWRIGTTANAAYLASALRDPKIGPFEVRLGAGTPAGASEDLYHYWRLLAAGYRIRYLPEARVAHAHRETMDGLLRQLCAYRRAETAFQWLMWTRHRDRRALGQVFLWIPYWRFRLTAGELLRRLTGRRRYSLRVLWLETLAYFEGPAAIKRTPD
jgi:cellulose synthase/poly-beta-1,6-N-acetylglucosamine synthase-like glycosyltransferase